MNTATLSELRATQLAPVNQPSAMPVTMGFDTAAGFDLLQRVSKAFAGSVMVPEVYRGNIGNCCIALDMATRLRAAPLLVMQNLYIVHGTPGWSAKFLIATWNQCGRYTSMRYEFTGEPNTEAWTCRAWSTEIATGEKIIGPAVSVGMAKAEGWSTKNGSKWKTMPELMLTYRAAAFLVRTYAPELSMGLQTAEELADVLDARRAADGSFSVDLDALAAAEPKPAEPKADAKPAPAAVDTGGVTDVDAPADAPAVTFAQVASALHKAKSADTLEIAADLIGSVADEQQRSELTDLYTERKAKLA